MLTALPSTRQNEAESKRVWYFSDSLDMYVWFDKHNVPYAFDLTYKTRRFYQERTVSWHRERGYRHWRAEEGRQRFGTGDLLVQAGPFDRSLVAAQFLAQCVDLPAQISREVLVRLAAFELSANPANSYQHQVAQDTGASLSGASD